MRGSGPAVVIVRRLTLSWSFVRVVSTAITLLTTHHVSSANLYKRPISKRAIAMQ